MTKLSPPGPPVKRARRLSHLLSCLLSLASRMRHHPRMTDPITVAVLQNRLNAIAEEIGEAMLRTAYSQILNSSRDFSIALIDAGCRLVAQADHIPVHV